MGHARSVLTKSSFYLISSVLVQVCAFISFPIWTRLLSKDEYGVFSLVVSSIMVLSSISKFGLQHAVLRFYPEFKESGEPEKMSSFFSSVAAGNIVMSTVASAVFVVLALSIARSFGNFESYAMLLFAAGLAVTSSVNSIQINFLRAAENARLYAAVCVTKRYGEFLLALVIVSLLWGFKWLFMGWVIADVLVVFYLWWLLAREYGFDLRKISVGVLLDSMKYGLPLVGFELSATLLAIGDRYLIQAYMNEGAVGVYSAGYNIASYGPELLSVPLRLAVMPRFLMLWETRGESETRDFLNSMLRYYAMAGIPIIFGMIYLRQEIVSLLASAKFLESSDIIPYVCGPMLLYGGVFIYGAGYYISKKNVSLAVFTFASVLLNVVMNIFLIPRYGLKGAAIATLVAYSMLCIAVYVRGRRYIKIEVPWGDILRCCALGSMMIIGISRILGTGPLRLGLKIVVGAMIYAFGLAIVDREVRGLALDAIRRISGGRF